MASWLRLLLLLAVASLGFGMLMGCMQRRLLYYPTHYEATGIAAQSGLAPWTIDGAFTGYARVVAPPRKIWLVLHGNGGQAAQRGYIVSRVNPADAVFIVEYPGYGQRAGKPSREAFDAAARQAYTALLQRYGPERLIVLGESLGSGPACALARGPTPPRHLVLIVPFDVLTRVAQEKFSWLPVDLIMLDRWDNMAALTGYSGRIDIFGALHDEVIPVHHARALAASVPQAVFHAINTGHGWADSAEVDLSHF